MTSAIRFENVSKKFRLQTVSQKSIQELLIGFLRKPFQPEPVEEIWPLRNLSFDIAQGSTTGIIGPNGAGKSTLLKLVTGILKPTQGRIAVNGSVAAMLELGTGFHPDLTGRENLYLYGTMFGVDQQEMSRKIPDIIDFSELGRFVDMPIKNYSSGMLVRLGFAATTQVETDILLLDEVLAVGDYGFQKKCWLKFKEFQAAGKTIVLISHDLLSIQELCSQALLIEQGQLTAAGEVHQVVEAYYHHLGNDQGFEGPETTTAQTGETHHSPTKIIDVELLDDRGENIEVVEGGQPVTIRVNYRANSGIKDALFGLQIWGETHEHIGNQVVCHDTNTAWHDFAPLQIKGESAFEVQYPRLQLAAGKYFLRVAIFPPEPDRDPYATSFRVCSFEVRNDHHRDGMGLVSMPHQWRVPE